MIIERLQGWAQSKPDQVYLTQPQPDGSVTQYSWAQVWSETRRMAAYLQSLALPAGSSIAIYGKNSAHWFMADLATWMSGHVTVPLYPTASSATADYVLRHCEARAIFIGRLDGVTDSWNEVQAVLPPALPRIGLPMSPDVPMPRWHDIVSSREPLVTFSHRAEKELATIIYTSGTTGQPKGVMHSFASLIAPCEVTAEFWKTNADDRMLSYLPLAHIGERVAVEVPSLMFGFQVFFNLTLESFADDLKRARPTRFFSVPRLWTKFYQAVNQQMPPEQQRALFADPVQGPAARKGILAKLGLDAAHIGFTAAAPLPAQILSWYRELGLDLIEVYGMTENAATSHACRRDDVRPGYVGVPLPGVECRIADDGEVLVRSPGQMLGYYRDEEASRQCYTADGFFRTGDRGEVDDAGRLRITGRVKELFKTSKGKYVAPVPVENRLGAHPAIEAICVTGHGEPQPFALALLNAQVLAQARSDANVRSRLEQEIVQLLDQVNAALEAHERVEYLVLVKEPWTIESELLTPTMKIRRSQLERRYLGRASEWRALGTRVIWEG